MLIGNGSAWLRVALPFDGMLVAILPPGAFFGMAVLLALRNRLMSRRETARSAEAAADSAR
jgi:Na+-translocating ferredoxin:NAD+ oxidoreductase RnfE subunit